MKEHFPSDLEMAGAALIGVNRGDRETHTIVLGRWVKCLLMGAHDLEREGVLLPSYKLALQPAQLDGDWGHQQGARLSCNRGRGAITGWTSLSFLLLQYLESRGLEKTVSTFHSESKEHKESTSSSDLQVGASSSTKPNHMIFPPLPFTVWVCGCIWVWWAWGVLPVVGGACAGKTERWGPDSTAPRVQCQRLFRRLPP